MVRLLNTLRRTVLPRCTNMSRFSTAVCVKDNMLMTPIGMLNTTTELCVVDTTQGAKWPVFRLLQSNGKLVEGVPEPTDVSEDVAVKMYSSMVQIQVLDEIMMLAQRQGRISFYMQAAGEEAIHVGK
jgi:2-oxoisovalerate dehydrogenase E1 component alpha subunit